MKPLSTLATSEVMGVSRSQLASPVRVALMLAACRPGGETPPSQRGMSRDTSSPFVAGSLPPIGLAVADSVRAWCAEFVVDSTAPSLKPGRHVTIVFAGPPPSRP